ncbi:pre-toxin TG domain-containing protein, partial [Paenibacillus larvae]
LPKLKSLGFDFDFSSYLTLENVSVAIDLIPIVGNIKAGGEVISGYDPITGVPLEGPDYVLGIIGIIVGGEFKQVGKIAGKATELEAKANKITKSMVTKVPSEIKLSTGNIKHLWNGHSFESFANQIPYLMKTKSRDAVEKQLSNISFFNKNLSKEEIVSSVEKAANEALSNGVTHGQYKTKINGEIITVAFDNGTFQTAWGTHNYTLSDFGY